MNILINQFKDQTFIKEFANEARKMRNHFASNKSFEEKKRVMSYAMTSREDLLLRGCIETVRGLGIEIMVLIFDGFQVPKSPEIEVLIDEINTLDHRIRFVKKSFDECGDVVKLLKSYGCEFRNSIRKGVPSNEQLIDVISKYIPPNIMEKSSYRSTKTFAG